MRRTLPQIIMLNHAAWVEQKESDARVEARRKAQEQQRAEEESDPFIAQFGCRMSELKENETKLDAYLADWSDFA